jgi:hypothetical protein
LVLPCVWTIAPSINADGDIIATSNGYVQGKKSGAGAPTSGDCDADAERGRQYIDTTNNRWYLCNGATRGWDYVALTN